MANSPQESEQSSQLMTPDYESPENPQNLSTAIASTPEPPSAISVIPSDSVTTLQKASADILQAIENQQWKTMLELVRGQTPILNPWWVEKGDTAANYQGAKGDCIEGFHITFDEEHEDRIAKAVSIASEGNLPVHRMTEFITKTQQPFNLEQIKKSISILSGSGRPGNEYWRQKNAKGRNALHIAAAGQGKNSERALRALLELMAVKASGDCLAGLDDQTQTKGRDDNTALHLAALNIPKAVLSLPRSSFNIRPEALNMSIRKGFRFVSESYDIRTEALKIPKAALSLSESAFDIRPEAHLWGNYVSSQPFNRLLRAGANPWIQNRSKDTVLHLLNRERQAKKHDEKSGNIEGDESDDARIQHIRDSMRIQGARDILRQDGDWKPQLVATNRAGKTAMSLALSTKDYKMVIALMEAPRTASFVRETGDEDIWNRDGAAAFDVAVLTLDTDLDAVRGSLIRSLARDQFVKKCFNKRDKFGLTALHKVCNLEEDRDDIVMALLKNGAKIRKRVGQPVQQYSKGSQRYVGWSALSFALERGHRWSVSLLLANGAMDDLSPSEWSDIRQRAYEGNYIGWDLIQYFRTHVSDNTSEVLARPRESKRERTLDFLAIKWPCKGKRFGIADEEDVLRDCFKAFDYSSYPDKRLVRHMIYGNDDTSWDTWTRRNGGWIHLPANNWKWIEGICRSSYINEEKFPHWLQSHLDRGAAIEILKNTYMTNEELRRMFPQFRGLFPEHSSQETFESQRYPPTPSEHRRRQLAIEYRKVLAFMQDSLANVQQHGTKHRRVRHGFRSLVVQRQYPDQIGQPSLSTVKPGGDPRPAPTYVDKNYTLKSVVLPILDVDWMLSYLEVAGDDSSTDKSSCDSQKSTQESVASQSNGPIRDEVFCNRLDESKVIVKMDRGLQPDRRTERHWDQMERLYKTFKDTRKPFSLDQYFHQDLTNREVKARVSSQVVSRFIYYQHCSTTHSPEKKSMTASNISQGQKRILLNRFRNLNLNLRQLFKRQPEWDVERSPECSPVVFPQVNHDSNSESDPDSDSVGEHVHAPPVTPDSNSESNSDSGPVGDPVGEHVDVPQVTSDSNSESDPDNEPESNTESNCEIREDRSEMMDILQQMLDPPWQQILIVPQLWLFTVDNLLIHLDTVLTSFPDRWDRFNAGSSLPHSFEQRVKALPRSIDADELLHEILECAMQYIPSFPASGVRFTYSEAFSGEIRRLIMESRVIEACYDKFHDNLGNSDDVFLDAFQTPTYCLRTIDDVLRELDMIKRVYQDQTRVWEDFHNVASSRRDMQASRGMILDPDNRKCPYSTTCDPKVLPQRLFTTVSNLVDEAKIVQESAVTLLTLLQGEASTENTISTSKQSKILGIFTVVTVIFAPLSWMAAIFALQVQNTTWTWLKVFEGSFASFLITLLLCALGWLSLDGRNVKKVSNKVQTWLDKLSA